MLFPQGTIFDMTTMYFVTEKISPLYRYSANKKDLSKPEKPLMVTLPHPLFNSIVAEIVRWNDVIRNVSVQANPLQASQGA